MNSRDAYANVTATLALIVALTTGTAYAAFELAPNSVGTAQLRPVAVTAAKVRENAVTTPKIMSIAIKQGKIEDAAVTGAKIASGAVIAEKIAKAAATPEKIPDGSLDGVKIDEAELGQVPSADTANIAGFAETSNPEVFVRVSSEGVVSPSSSKGIGAADVENGPEPGIYCLTIPSFAPRGAQAIIGETTDSEVSVYVRLAGTAACPYPQIEVQTYNGGGRTKEPFYLVAYR